MRMTDRIYFGDNLEILRSLPDASVQLIYIDPPFNTGRRQSRKQIRTVESEEGDRTVKLVMNTPSGHVEKRGKIYYYPDGRTIEISNEQVFEIHGQEFEVKDIDATQDTVLLLDLSVRKEVWIGPQKETTGFE